MCENNNAPIDWKLIEQMCRNADSITWDSCHKIYLAMDKKETKEFVSYGYDPIIRKGQLDSKEMAATLKQWYEDSCGLRFISAVFSNAEDPNYGFVQLVPQFFE